MKRTRAAQALLSLLVLAGMPASPKLAESSTSERPGGAAGRRRRFTASSGRRGHDQRGRERSAGPPTGEVQRVRRTARLDSLRVRPPVRLRLFRTGRGQQGAGRARSPVEVPRRTSGPVRPPQLQASHDVERRHHVRRREGRMVLPADGDHGGRSGDLGTYLRRPHQGGLLAEQGDDRLRRMDDRACPDERRDAADSRRRHQVAGLRAQGAHPLEPRVLR